MRHLKLALLGLGAVLTAAACCPIPMTRQASLHPQWDLTVQSAQGAPVDGAKITIRRYVSGPPPARETHRWEPGQTTQGFLHLPENVQSERYMPYVMHGVNWYSWQVCATHPSHGSQSVAHDATQPIESPVALTIQLDPALKDCGWRPMDGQ